MAGSSQMSMCRRCGTLNRVVPGRTGAQCGRCQTPLEAPASGGGGGGGSATAARPAPQPGQRAAARPVEVDERSFKREVLESDLPVLLDCWAPWCGPCHMLAPALDALASQHAGRLKVCKLNVEEAQGLAQQLQVMALPTLVAFRNGLPIGRQMGVQSADRITAWLRDLGAV